jgi:hypothetical protein
VDKDLSLEEIQNIRSFKSELFQLYWEKFGTFYLHVLPHPKLIIGKRGLIGEEIESGIILVFGPKAVRDVQIYEFDFFAELQFGYTWEDVTIPWDSVFRIYDKTQSSLVQMRILPILEEPASGSKKSKTSGTSDSSSPSEIRPGKKSGTKSGSSPAPGLAQDSGTGTGMGDEGSSSKTTAATPSQKEGALSDSNVIRVDFGAKKQDS